MSDWLYTVPLCGLMKAKLQWITAWFTCMSLFMNDFPNKCQVCNVMSSNNGVKNPIVSNIYHLRCELETRAKGEFQCKKKVIFLFLLNSRVIQSSNFKQSWDGQWRRRSEFSRQSLKREYDVSDRMVRTANRPFESGASHRRLRSAGRLHPPNHSSSGMPLFSARSIYLFLFFFQINC